MEADDAVGLENALNLRSGELLEGFCDDCALPERERISVAAFQRHGAHDALQMAFEGLR